MSQHTELALLGWREWIELPDLGIVKVKAKIDTGARSSALHALEIERFNRTGRQMVRFKVFSNYQTCAQPLSVETDLLDRRQVRSSSGQTELRSIIQTHVAIRGQCWPIELTLTDRTQMGFPMLLGRQAMRGRFAVDPGQSYLQSATRSHRFRQV
ncbi:MAG: ATP-dependent zinc protease [Leptolyngbyaceae cyanobacterium SM1_1_3]|nr:ATP-dependent zinc protease [Leptolyngbyaceae cyanobacterium SM1_1_3]NJM85384.1 ATP-dependent zinc protease [Leptolyngbyaceae cyanobacterium RM2_2_21]NJN04310.1 ATP-dependent zinc protease [Leptolyngbyaceae cyanobacterium RM1_1_2]NJO10417.1 ATP-dependent zinc protease [Leptolyngbyaceae cyanobacterium SL_1_1]